MGKHMDTRIMVAEKGKLRGLYGELEGDGKDVVKRIYCWLDWMAVGFPGPIVRRVNCTQRAEKNSASGNGTLPKFKGRVTLIMVNSLRRAPLSSSS